MNEKIQKESFIIIGMTLMICFFRLVIDQDKVYPLVKITIDIIQILLFLRATSNLIKSEESKNNGDVDTHRS